MKKFIFGCTLLIMGAILITSLTPATIGLWIVGLVFVILGSDYDQEKNKN